MAWTFGDGFDCYATVADAVAGYWDGGSINFALIAGRFTGSQALSFNTAGTAALIKSSGANDSIHHIVCAYRQTATLSGSTLGTYFQLVDNVTNQCCVVFRSDGAVLLTSATPGGAVLATYTGAVSAQNTWFAFEFEVIISATVGAFRARKNGNTSNDFDSGASLNTRPGANSYANKIQIGQATTLSNTQLDDILWRSDAASVPWVGDIRAYTRMPASDASVQFSRSPSVSAFVPFTTPNTTAFTNGTAVYTAFTAPYSGTVGSAALAITTGYTGNLKCSLFASAAGVPTTVLGSATTITNPVSGSNTFTFGTPVSVTQGTQYFIGFDSDTSGGLFNRTSLTNTGLASTTAYAAFPAASPTTTATVGAAGWTINITTAVNAHMTNETLQDGATSYVYDSNVGDADFYAIAALAGTPSSTVCVITRGFVQKSDAGTRNAAVQLKSGATTVTSTSTALSTSWGWLWRTDTVDPATSAAWTATGVNNVQVGPIVTA